MLARLCRDPKIVPGDGSPRAAQLQSYFSIIPSGIRSDGERWKLGFNARQLFFVASALAGLERSVAVFAQHNGRESDGVSGL